MSSGKSSGAGHRHILESFDNADDRAQQPYERRATGNRPKDPEMFLEFLRFLEHRLRGQRARCVEPLASFSFQNIQENPSGGTLRVLLAYGNRQVSLSLLDRFEEGFRNAQGDGTHVLKRPEAFQYHRDADYRQQNKRISGDGAFVNDVDGLPSAQSDDVGDEMIICE